MAPSLAEEAELAVVHDQGTRRGTRSVPWGGGYVALLQYSSASTVCWLMWQAMSVHRPSEKSKRAKERRAAIIVGLDSTYPGGHIFLKLQVLHPLSGSRG